MFRKLMVVVASVVLLGILSVPSQVSGKERVTLEFWSCQGLNIEQFEAQKKSVEKYMEMNPDIKIIFQLVMDDPNSKLLTAYAAGTMPQMITHQDEPFKDFVRRGIYMDITPYVEKDPTIDASKLFPRSLKMFQYEGRQYALPIAGGPITLYYNKNAYDEVGLPYPDKPTEDWNYDVFLQYAKKLTRDTDADGRIDKFAIAAIAGEYSYFEPWLWGFGGAYFKKDKEGIVIEPAEAVIDTPEAARAFQFYQDMFWKYNFSPRATQEAILGREAFQTGMVAMKVTGPWGILPARRAAKARPDFRWDIGYLPVGPAGTRNTRSTWDGLEIPSQCPKDKVEDAYKFISYYIGPESQRMHAEAVISLPSLREAAHTYFPDPDTPEHEERFIDIMENYALIQPLFDHEPAIRHALQKWFDLLVENKVSGKEAAKEMQVDMEKILRGE